MKILQINASYGIGSTGKIMADLDSVICEFGNEGYMLAGYGKTNLFGDEKLLSFNNSNTTTATKYNLLISRITGVMGYRHRKKTKEAIEWIDSKNPDIIHLHNIHGDWINIGLLFDYLKRKKTPVIWTLHDCWSFTGRCSHFENCGCEKWRTGCYKCCNKKVYPITYVFDWSQKMWEDKKELFTGLEKLTIVTPSDWLGTYVKQSFLSIYPIMTIRNGIDIKTFRPRTVDTTVSNLIGDKKMILGVASTWTERKGLYDFYKLADLLGEEYQIVLVGLNTKQIQSLPSNVIGIERTNSSDELAVLYSAADYFLNLTYLDNYPTTNLEAQACGTPVITYKTGGSPESVKDEGFVVEKGKIRDVSEIIKTGARKDSIKYRKIAEAEFDANKCFEKYLELYDHILFQSK
jgi:putative colanic acid biosynthesis glycosyltransferase